MPDEIKNLLPLIHTQPSAAGTRRRRRQVLRALLWKIRRASSKHPIAIAVGEIAVGATLLTAAVSMGAALLASHTGVSLGGKVGAFIGGTAGAAVGELIGGIGVAALGTAIGIPALLLTLASTILSSLAGYAVGDLISRVLDPVTFVDWIGPGFLMIAGLWLLRDGVRRLYRHPPLRHWIRRLFQDAFARRSPPHCA